MSPAERSGRRSLDAALVKGVAWTGAANWIAQGFTWVSTLVVVRLLTPDDYGLVALAGVYLGLVTMLSEFGLATAVVTLRDLTKRQIAELNTVAMLFAALAVLASVLVSSLIATFFASPRLTQVIWVMSSVLVVGAIGNVSTALLQKGLHFRFLASVQIVQAVTAAIATLVIALLGGGYWALALGPAGGHAIAALLVVLRKPCGYAWPDWGTMGPVLRFSRHVITERAAWYAYTSSDKLVIGRWMGEIPLGLYSVASTFGMMAVEKVTVLMLRVAPAVFSAVQHDPVALRRYLLSMTEGVAIVTFPLSIGLALTAPDVVALLLGPQWAGAVVPLQFLALYGAFQSISPLLNRVLAVVGDTAFRMRISLITLGLLPVVFIFATRWDLSGVAAAWLVVPMLQIPLYVRLHTRIGLTALGYLQSLWPAVSSVMLMTLAILVLRRSIATEGLPVIGSLALTVVVGAIVYSSAILLLHRGRIRLFRTLMAEMGTSGESGAIGVVA